MHMCMCMHMCMHMCMWDWVDKLGTWENTVTGKTFV